MRSWKRVSWVLGWPSLLCFAWSTWPTNGFCTHSLFPGTPVLVVGGTRRLSSVVVVVPPSPLRWVPLGLLSFLHCTVSVLLIVPHNTTQNIRCFSCFFFLLLFLKRKKQEKDIPPRHGVSSWRKELRKTWQVLSRSPAPSKDWRRKSRPTTFFPSSFPFENTWGRRRKGGN